MNLAQAILTKLSNGELYSGQVLADELGVTRTAVWKVIQQLRNQGVDIEIQARQGYRLAKPVELLNEKKIRSDLQPVVANLISQIEVFQTIPSTNQHLVANFHQFPSGAICLSEQQTQGRGRRGRGWLSPFASGIYLSILWHFDVDISSLQGLSLAIGVAVIHALQRYGIQGVELKWPNDLFYQSKKLAGILLEAHASVNSHYSIVVGIGLNCRLPQEVIDEVERPVIDLETILQNPLGRNHLIALILNEMVPILRDFPKTGLEPYIPEWQRYDVLQNQQVQIELPSGTMQGKVLGVDRFGNLKMQFDDGREQVFSSAEITIRR